MLEGILLFHFGKVQDARRTIEEAEKLAQPDDPSASFSLAFLALWQGKFEPAIRYFRKIESMECTGEMILNIITFYHSLLRTHPKKFQLKFGLAVINECFCDLDTAITDYQQFIEAAQADKTFEPLTTFAREKLITLQVRN